MRRLILILAAIGLIFWSLLAWAASGLLGIAEGMAATGAPFIPLPPELVYWLAGLMSGAGGVLVWVVWFIGAAIIGLATMVLLAVVRPLDSRSAGQVRYPATYEPMTPGESRYQHPPVGGAGSPNAQPQAGAGSRSAEEIVSRVLGKPTRR